MAHPDVELEAWRTDWTQRTRLGLTPDLVQEFVDMASRHPAFFGYTVTVTKRGTGKTLPAEVERWRPLVAQYFPDVDKALAVMWCESRGDPSATNLSSGAAGLFQHLPKYWQDRSAAAGWAGADIYDPEANVAVAGWLRRTGGWGHWACA